MILGRTLPSPVMRLAFTALVAGGLCLAQSRRQAGGGITVDDIMNDSRALTVGKFLALK